MTMPFVSKLILGLALKIHADQVLEATIYEPIAHQLVGTELTHFTRTFLTVSRLTQPWPM
jgi:hypothetical protein